MCFHPEFGKEVYPIKFPTMDPELKKPIGGPPTEILVTQDEFLDWLYETNEYYFPNMPAFELIQGAFKVNNGEVCLTAFVDESLGELIDLEAHCEAYKRLPFDGGVFDQPQLFLDAFSIVRTEKNRYQNVKSDKMLQSLKSQTGSTAKPKPGRGLGRG